MPRGRAWSTVHARHDSSFAVVSKRTRARSRPFVAESRGRTTGHNYGRPTVSQLQRPGGRPSPHETLAFLWLSHPYQPLYAVPSSPLPVALLEIVPTVGDATEYV